MSLVQWAQTPLSSGQRAPGQSSASSQHSRDVHAPYLSRLPAVLGGLEHLSLCGGGGVSVAIVDIFLDNSAICVRAGGAGLSAVRELVARADAGARLARAVACCDSWEVDDDVRYM